MLLPCSFLLNDGLNKTEFLLLRHNCKKSRKDRLLLRTSQFKSSKGLFCSHFPTNSFIRITCFKSNEPPYSQCSKLIWLKKIQYLRSQSATNYNQVNIRPCAVGLEKSVGTNSDLLGVVVQSFCSSHKVTFHSEF